MPLPKISGMDFGNAVPLDDVIADLRDPHTQIDDLLIGVPTEGAAPEYPIEAALAERWDIDTDEDGYPYRTFALGGLSAALIDKYSTKWRTLPPVLLGRLSIDNADEPSASLEAILPSAVPGQTKSAATISALYVPKVVTHAQSVQQLQKLSRTFVPRSKKIIPNPFYKPAATDPNAVGAIDKGYGHSVRNGRLGTR